MEARTLQFWQLLYSLSDLLEEKISSRGKARITSKSAEELATWFYEKLKEEGFIKSVKSDKRWWMKTTGIFNKALSNGLLKEEIREIFEIAFKDEWYKSKGYIIHPKGILRNYEAKWLLQKKQETEKTSSTRNFTRFLK